MKSLTNVAMVIPCYNEELRLQADVFTRELLHNQGLTLMFVDDGSQDNTLKVIQTMCESSPERAFYVSLDKNRGKGEAVRIGICKLLEKGPFNLIGFWDADLAVPLSEIDDFVGIFQSNSEVRAVIGSRVHLAGRSIERISFRHYLGRLFATVMCLTFGFVIYDTQCGAKIFNRDVISPVVQDHFSSKWIFDVEILLRISRLASMKNSYNWLYEIPVKEWKNVSETKRSIAAYINSVFDYIKLIRTYLYNK